MATQKTATKKRVLTDETEVTVINNTSGMLFYRSPRTQDEWEWAEYGDEHEMSVRELKAMKAQHRRFFDDQWIIFPEKDYDVISYLKVEKNFQNIVTPEQIDELFDKSNEEFIKALNSATINVKDLIFTKAKEKYLAGELTNVHILDAIETNLGVLIDPEKLK